MRNIFSDEKTTNRQICMCKINCHRHQEYVLPPNSSPSLHVNLTNCSATPKNSYTEKLSQTKDQSETSYLFVPLWLKFVMPSPVRPHL